MENPELVLRLTFRAGTVGGSIRLEDALEIWCEECTAAILVDAVGTNLHLSHYSLNGNPTDYVSFMMLQVRPCHLCPCLIPLYLDNAYSPTPSILSLHTR